VHHRQLGQGFVRQQLQQFFQRFGQQLEFEFERQLVGWRQRREPQVSAAVHQSSGTHFIADLYGVDPVKLADPVLIENVLRNSALAAGATIVFSHFHAFGPGQGVTGVVLLAESHISIHTWPETGFAAADLFMCGRAAPQRALDLIRAALLPAECKIQGIDRGASIPSPMQRTGT
jgi:S-adenosylmethionine decarboxylase